MTESPRLRVLRIITHLNVGGPARQVLLLQEQLPRLGVDTLLVHGQTGPGEAAFPAPPERPPYARRIEIASLGRSLSALDDARTFLSLCRIVFRYEPDVIHTHMAKAGTLGRLAGMIYNITRTRRRRAVLLHTFHGHVFHGYFSRAGSLLARIIERALGALSDRIIAISPSQKTELGERFRIVRPDKIAIIPLGFSLDALLDLPEQRPEAGPIRCVFVGRLVPIKDVATLLRAFAQAAERHDLSLRIVGDGPCRPELESLTRELGIDERVVFTGWQRDLPAIYRNADLVLMSSLNEGTPVAVIEAMAAGRAVIATAVGGVPDVVTDGETGRLVPRSAPGALADAIVELAQDPEQLLSFGLAGRAHVRRVYHGERLVDDLARLYSLEVARRRDQHPRASA